MRLAILAAVALFAVALVLFIIILPFCILPIRYSIKAATGDGAFAVAKVSYLFRLIRFVYEFREGKSTSTLHIAWKKIDMSGNNPEKAEGLAYPGADKKASRSLFSKKKYKESQAHEEPKQKGGFRKILKKIRAVLTYPNRKIIMRLVKEALRRTTRVLWPRHLIIFGEVGFSDPMQTGLFMGAYEAITSAFGLRRKICLQGDFTADNFVARLNIEARGRVSIARLSLPIIWLLLKKPIRSLIKDLRRKGDS